MPPLPQDEVCDESVIAELCAQYQTKLEWSRNPLRSALDSIHAINWENLVGEYELVTPKPEAPIYYEWRPAKPEFTAPESPSYAEYPSEPQRND